MDKEQEGVNLYFTRRVKEEVGIPLAFSIIEAVKTMEVERDYLQIFTLEVLSEDLIAIEHSQEQPSWTMTYYVERSDRKYNKDINGMKLYMVIESDHAILMLAEEY